MSGPHRPHDSANEFGDSARGSAASELAETEGDEAFSFRAYQMLPIVGLGGSAGGIEALQVFFSKVAPDTGMAFVVILHLSPEHESLLPELIQHCTAMPVVPAADGGKVEANHVYVIPPGKHLLSMDGHLRLQDVATGQHRHMAVDLFFRTLAETHGPHAVAIVLSGADGDGALGIKSIKEHGGLTIAQDPDEAGHDGMPRAAIATGMVDWVLPVDHLPARLAEYRERERRLSAPPEDNRQPARPPSARSGDGESVLRDVLVFLRTRTGRDFSYYKRATVLRRISRRLQVNGLDDLPSYLEFLRTNPGESGALLQDLLISVTNFFRDREAFAALEARIPELFLGKGPGDTVRVWVAACATGEEAYSIAILLCEHARTLDSPPLIQVFATDLDDEVIQMARGGVYPDAIAADVSEDRLRRFFVKEHRGYRVRREVREVVLFALHDLLKDSPFSRLDLVSCRNLLIYLNRDAQARAFEIFHFALRPGGRLFLGSSESAEDGNHLFSVVEKKHRIYAQRSAARMALPVPIGPSTLARALEMRERATDRPIMPGPGGPMQPPIPDRSEVGTSRPSWGDVHFRLLERLAPPSLLVNREQEIVHLSEKAGRFLQFSGGEPTTNLLRAVHPMLRIEMRAALYRAAQTGAPADAFQVPVDMEGRLSAINIHVSPATESDPDLFLVVLEECGAPEAARSPAGEPDSLARQLEGELDGTKAQLRDLVEQYEASTEELKASNEELQAMNEELRSATEELETSREELQSINEELTTVNQELKGKLDELGSANSDLHNLMGATAIATVFLGRDLRITRFTPPAIGLFSLISTDLGRPLTDLTHRLDYPELAGDARRVLDQLVPVDREVAEAGGRWFLARVLPYRTLQDQIAGVVLTFVDITERRKAEEALRQALVENVRARSEIEAAAQAKDQFLAALSHELRTPLTPILMMAQMLSGKTELPEQVRDGLRMIERNVEMECHLIDDLLDLTRIASGRLEIDRLPVDLHAVVQGALEIARADVNAKEQQLTISLEAARSRVSGDNTRLQQVVWNLVKNASQFTPVGGQIRISTRATKDRIVLEVADNGAGIEPGSLLKIFDPFAQSGPKVVRKFGGLGLGLAISRAAVNAHGGTLRAESEGLGRGATFLVELPLD